MIDLAADSHIFVGDFGESVGFRTSSSGDTRTVTAVVNRQPVTDDNASPIAGSRQPIMHVMFRNHATLGVTPGEVVEDASEIMVAFKLGDSARWRKVTRMLRQNPGCVLLEVQS